MAEGAGAAAARCARRGTADVMVIVLGVGVEVEVGTRCSIALAAATLRSGELGWLCKVWCVCVLVNSRFTKKNPVVVLDIVWWGAAGR